MSRSVQFIPGVPVGGHVVLGSGAWHPGSAENCRKGNCNPRMTLWQPLRGYQSLMEPPLHADVRCTELAGTSTRSLTRRELTEDEFRRVSHRPWGLCNTCARGGFRP